MRPGEPTVGTEGILYYAEELLAGRTLRDELFAQGRLAPARALRIVADIADAVSEAHGRGIIHRDLTPDKIHLYVSEGIERVKVRESLIAQVAGDAVAQPPGMVFGTPGYMSPEQFRGTPLDPRADVYALGVMLYELLAGYLPFDAPSATEVAMMHLRSQPAPLVDVPEVATQIAFRALAKERAERQPHCRALAKECRAALSALS
jgi:serine/threonine-protein kinase